MTTTICYTCREEIPANAKHFAATFYGQNRQVCPDCAEGIYDGTNVFMREGVSGEFLGACGDNNVGEKP